MSMIDEIYGGTVGTQMASNKPVFELIHVNDIRPNKLNFFHIYDEEVQALANEIERENVNNGRVYYQEDSDGKHYTLIGGETRYRALLLLYNEGRHDGMFPMYIVRKPESEVEELSMIMGDNHQRYLSEEDKRVIIQNYEKVYEHYKQKDKELDRQIKSAENPLQAELLEEKRCIQKGTSKRDWIVTKTNFINRDGTNISGRQVQKYLTGEFSGKEQKKEPAKKPKEKATSESTNAIKEVLKAVKQHLVDVTDAGINITEKKLTITYANIYDLDRILGALKDDEELNHITSSFIRAERSK